MTVLSMKNWLNGKKASRRVVRAIDPEKERAAALPDQGQLFFVTRLQFAEAVQRGQRLLDPVAPGQAVPYQPTNVCDANQGDSRAEDERAKMPRFPKRIYKPVEALQVARITGKGETVGVRRKGGTTGIVAPRQ